MRKRSNEARTRAIYNGIRARCEDPEHSSYKWYGARGIKFLFTSYEQFIATTEGEYRPGLSVDRKENDGHYEPGNTRWATDEEQGSNKRNNVRITHAGMTKTIAEWARHYGYSYDSFHRKLNGKRDANAVLIMLDKQNEIIASLNSSSR